MRYRLTGRYRVDFTAYAPMHTFKGHTEEAVEAELEIDFNARTLTSARARADVRKFTTLDPERDRAMQNYMDPDANPEAAIEMTRMEVFEQIDESHYRIQCLAILSFMGIRRQMPVSFSLVRGEDSGFTIDMAFKWSFKAYGLKAPRLLFLTVRDIVDIRGKGGFGA